MQHLREQTAQCTAFESHINTTAMMYTGDNIPHGRHFQHLQGKQPMVFFCKYPGCLSSLLPRSIPRKVCQSTMSPPTVQVFKTNSPMRFIGCVIRVGFMMSLPLSKVGPWKRRASWRRLFSIEVSKDRQSRITIHPPGIHVNSITFTAVITSTGPILPYHS